MQKKANVFFDYTENSEEIQEHERRYCEKQFPCKKAESFDCKSGCKNPGSSDCYDNQCINSENVGNGNKDCQNGSDEDKEGMSRFLLAIDKVGH